MTFCKYKPQKATLTHFNGQPIVGATPKGVTPPPVKQSDKYIMLGDHKFRVIPVNVVERPELAPEEAYIESLRCYMK